MAVFGNIIAVLLMVVVPYLRPCSCVEFTLLCQCGSVQIMDDVADKTADIPAEALCPN
ncbi:MAG: hypothetical protein L3J82_10510 [Planctomycetes bacterium]|nr:hypothetical protein [Planctomycetota bacterium]